MNVISGYIGLPHRHIHLHDHRPHLYFQAPDGQVLRLVGIGEDLSTYEGTEHGAQFAGRAFE
jgi:hypothetical protein